MRPHFLGRHRAPTRTLEDITRTINALATGPTTTESFFALASLSPDIAANNTRYFEADISRVSRQQDQLLRAMFEKTKLPTQLIEIGRCNQSTRGYPINNHLILADGRLCLTHLEHNGVTLTTIAARRFYGLVKKPLLAFKTFQKGSSRGIEIATLTEPHKLQPLQQTVCP